MNIEIGAGDRHRDEAARGREQPPCFVLSVRNDGQAGFSLGVTRIVGGEVEYADRALGTIGRSNYLDLGDLYRRFYETKLIAAADRAAHVHALGLELADRLPVGFNRFYREELRPTRGQASITVVVGAGVPSFPWELVKPRWGLDGNDGEFLGVTHAIGHWFAGLPWTRCVHVSRFAVMSTASEYEKAVAEHQLATQHKEPNDQHLAGALDLLREFDGTAEYRVASLRTLLALLRSIDPADDLQIVHLATHGANHGDHGPLLTFASDDEPGSLTVQVMPGFVGANADAVLKRRSPFVFLNACEAGADHHGSGGESSGGDGWAEVWCRAGSSAVVAPRWTVTSQPARVAARAFYRAVRGGARAGWALCAIRQAFYENGGDATWLAYTLHGHPDLKVTFDGVRD